MSAKNRRWRDVRRVLVRHGFVTRRQRGSHIQMYNPETGRALTLVRADPIKINTLRVAVIKSGIDWDEFMSEL